jgi:hypothetical protein
LDRIEVHVVAYQIAPYQNGMVTIMIPQIRFSDRPLTRVGIYFARFGYLHTIDLDGIIRPETFPNFVKWFVARARQEYAA